MAQPGIRFNGFSDEWVEKKLGDLFKKESVKNSQLNYGPSQIISLANLYYKNDFDKVPSDSYMKTYNEFKVGDIAFEGNKNKNYKYGRFVANTLGDGVISHVFEVYRAKVPFDTSYLGEFINYEPIMGRILRRTTKSTTMMTSLVSSDFLKETIQLPTLPEQQKIGSLFSKYDAIIALREQKLEELNALKKGLLQQMFDDGVGDEHTSQVRFSGFNDKWVEKKLGEMFDIKRGKVLAKTDVSMMPTSENKYPVYSSQTKDSGLMGYTDTWLFEDGITWTTDGANAGTVNYRSGKFFSTNVNGVLLKKTSVSNRFVAIAFGNVAKNHVTYIANPKLMSSTVSDISIKIPSLPEQQKIGQLFKQLDALISNEQAKIEQLKAQKQGLLQRML